MLARLTRDEMTMPVLFKGGPGSGMVGHRTTSRWMPPALANHIQNRSVPPRHQSSHDATVATVHARNLSARAVTRSDHTAAADAHRSAAMAHQHASIMNPKDKTHHEARAAEHYAAVAHHSARRGPNDLHDRYSHSHGGSR